MRYAVYWEKKVGSELLIYIQYGKHANNHYTEKYIGPPHEEPVIDEVSMATIVRVSSNMSLLY